MASIVQFGEASAEPGESELNAGQGGKMETVISEKGLICKGVEIEGPIGEQRVWTAVLLQAVKDLQSMNLRLRRAAEQSLLQDEADFEFASSGAGMSASTFRSRLRKHLPKISTGSDGTFQAAA